MIDVMISASPDSAMALAQDGGLHSSGQHRQQRPQISTPASPVQGSPSPFNSHGTRSRGHTVTGGNKFTALMGSIRGSASKSNLKDAHDAAGSHAFTSIGDDSSGTARGGHSSSASTSKFSALGQGIREFGAKPPGNRGRGGSLGGHQSYADDGYVPYNGPIEAPPQPASRLGNELLPPIQASFGPTISQQLRGSAAFSASATAAANDSDSRLRSLSPSAQNAKQGTPLRNSPQPGPPPSSPLPSLPTSAVFVFPRSTSRQPQITLSTSQTHSTSMLPTDETPHRSEAVSMAQRYSQPYSRPVEAPSRTAASWASPPPAISHQSASPKLQEGLLVDFDSVANLHRRPSLGTGLPTAYTHASADRPTNIDAAPYLPAALSFDRPMHYHQYPAPDTSSLNPAAFRPTFVGWTKPATTSYPIGSQRDGDLDSKLGPRSRAPSSINSGHSSEAPDASYVYNKDHPYERSGVGSHSAQTSMTSVRTFPSIGAAQNSSNKARSHVNTPSSQRHRRGENSSGHGSAGTALSDWAGSSSLAHVGTGNTRQGEHASPNLGSIDSFAQIENSIRGPHEALGLGPASRSVNAVLARGRQPRNVASVPDLRALPVVMVDASAVEPEAADGELSDDRQSDPEPVEVTTSPRTADLLRLEQSTPEQLRLETPSGPISIISDLASHRPQAPLSPIPSSMASPRTERNLDGSSPSTRDISNSGENSTPLQSSRSNGSRSDSNATNSASPGRRPDQVRRRGHSDVVFRTPSPQGPETWSMRERKVAQAKFHLLQQLHLEELIQHSVEFSGVLEPESGCDAVFRPRPALKNRGADTSRRYQMAGLPEWASASSSGHGSHSTIVPLEAGFERHRALRGQARNPTQAHRRTQTERASLDSHFELMSSHDRQPAVLQAGRQPFFHHRMPPEPPRDTTADKTQPGPIRSAAAAVAAPVAWCTNTGDVSYESVDEPVKTAPEYATLPIERRASQAGGEVELVYRMRSIPVGAQNPVTPEGRRERSFSIPLRKQPPTPDLIRTGDSSPEIDELDTPDLSTVIADGIWLDAQRAKWREQYRKGLDSSPAVVSWRRRSLSRSRSMSRTRNELPRGVDPTFYDQYRKTRNDGASSHDDAALDPRGGVLDKLQKKYKGDDDQPRGRVARQAIDDDRKYRTHQRNKSLRHSRSSPQLRKGALFADEAGEKPLPSMPPTTRTRTHAGLGLNQEAELNGPRSTSPEIPTSFEPFARRRVASLGKEAARKAAAAAAREKAHRRNRSASLSPERLATRQRVDRKHSKQNSGRSAIFGRKSRSPVPFAVPSAQPQSGHRYRKSATSMSRMRVHRNSASWDRAVETDSPVLLIGEERLSALQAEAGAWEPKSVVTDVPVVIATSPTGQRRSDIELYHGSPVTGHGAFQFPVPPGEGGVAVVSGVAIGSPPASQLNDSITDSYSSKAPALTTAGRHATTPSYHRQTDSSDLRAMLRNAHRSESEMSNEYNTGLASLPAPPRRRGRNPSDEGRHESQGSSELRLGPGRLPRSPLLEHPFNTPQFAMPSVLQAGAANNIRDRSGSALSGSDPRSTPNSLGAGSQSGSGSNRRELNGNRSASSAESCDTRPGSVTREVWMMDSGSREDDEEAQFQGLFFMPPLSDGSVPRSPHIHDGRPMDSVAGGSRVMLPLPRGSREKIDDELEESSEEMQSISIKPTNQLSASRASSDISPKVPAGSSQSRPREEKVKDDSPVLGASTATVAPVAGSTSLAARQLSPLPDSLASTTFFLRPATDNAASTKDVAAPSVSSKRGFRLGHVAGAEQTPQIVERSSMSRSSSSTGLQRTFRRGPTSTSSDTYSILAATTLMDELAESMMVHPNTSAVSDDDLDHDREGGQPRNARLLSFASQVGEVGMYEDDLDTP
ncbi:unnamed protein product [Tilletia laevis]|uniref:Uncharacterized protein n=2 Tax=Tilletia TaxID=13289 RepID=A0A177VF00_9BASI|nr:hypothetical protein A4X03_0g3787 [Tilletia caries]CAD6948504.1 unnamed protein product [Tilletia laevis]CAD6884444.1 unnamed protein product [Tilletia caries]CAD6903809.1 unnamed protein product [Tilletia caries]CAD6926684.1 unnamed protein product [Tilletia caries]